MDFYYLTNSRCNQGFPMKAQVATEPAEMVLA
jgi:hypothetical protein